MLNQSINLLLTWPKQRTATSGPQRKNSLQSAQRKGETGVGQTKYA